ncbi:MAG: hypothetical protein OMM_09374, partial [Candidatus Magnetoglobus multicellularis str. Araruama]
TPVPREHYCIGVPYQGNYEMLLNSDAACYGGSDKNNQKIVSAQKIGLHGRPYSLNLNLPPLAMLIFKMGAK